jgi:phage repressor protein C with HTH and peptisase S24 domain
VSKKNRSAVLQEWAAQITALRERLKINQAELARRMECSAMTVSRWERGLLRPSAQHFIQLGNLGNKSEAWVFWERAGIQASKMASALTRSRRSGAQFQIPHLEPASAGAHALHRGKNSANVGLPLLKAVVGSHGVPGDPRSSLSTIAATAIVGAPRFWCPNPGYTSMIRVKGHSMEPLIRHGDILAVDSFQTERSGLYGKVVVVASEKHGLCVSHLRRYQDLDVLEAENRRYEPVVLSKATGWRILGRVLWWISAAP